MKRGSVIAGIGASTIMIGRCNARSSESGSRSALLAALQRPNTLAFHAAKANILFGSMIGRDFFTDADYVRVVSQECSLVIGTLLGDSNLGLQEIDFADQNTLSVAGGYLVVHDNEPSAITSASDRSTALAALRDRVMATIRRYVGKIDHWIVVNEATNAEGLRKCNWLTTIGPDYIAEAFYAARKAAPNATLIINEAHLEDPLAEKQRATMLDLLTSLVRSGVPIDALGLQAHLRADHPTDSANLNVFFQRVQALGLKLIISEFDVVDNMLPADISLRDHAVAESASGFLNVALEQPGMIAISVWGLSDRHSWYNQTSTPMSLRRSDGEMSRGTLLDSNLRKKPIYFAVESALKKVAG